MIFLILFLFLSHLISFNTGQVYIMAPRLVSQNGNLKIYPGYNRNISLEVSGDKSWINVGQYNLLNVLHDVINATHNINRVYTTLITSQEAFVKSARQQISGRRGILTRLADLEIGRVNSTTGGLPVRKRQFQQLKNRVNALRRRVTTLETRFNNLVNNDACSSTPCANGGTCIENIKGYQCICPANWEGPQCSVDVNECSHFAGTDLGCQNGATCRNTLGSYECQCASGWFGLHCTKRSGDCAASANEEMCGHGICVSQNNDLGYKCICDQGWTTSGNSPACTQDVNECQGNHYPCSVIPLVPCINTPGSFVCGSCPAGYTGNGYYCTDINECLTNNGGCSSNPMVECINTVGSRMCGDCPPGYQGNGVICTFVGVCQVNNGGCHVFADCISNPMIGPTFVQCHCKMGYTGTGYGPMGCTPLAINSGVVTPPPNAILQVHCDPNPCVHGTCQQTPAGRQCICDVRYTGALCDQMRDPCVPQPCLNGGTCIGDNTTMGYRCECTTQYTGHSCESRNTACGGVRDMAEGRIVYPDSNSTNYSHNSRCAWLIVTPSNKVLNVTFTRFNLEVSTECLYDWLQIHDGRNLASHYIGRFCGNTLPMGGNIISTRNVLYLWFRSDHTVSKNGFEMSWTSIDPICGENINATSHGIIKSPGSPGKYPSNRDCKWIFTAPANKRIQLHFYTMQIETSPNCEHDYLAIYEGSTMDDKELAKYCGSIHPAPLLVQSPTAMIFFHSDNSNNDYGFQISYAVVEGEAGCGATYTQDRGEIVPPKVNGMYTSQSVCEYRIKLTPDTLIKLTFVEFSLEHSSSCQFDSVSVYDGDTRESGLLGKYCGKTLPPTLLSTSNKLLIVFVSDATYVSEGFRILYEEVCHFVFTGLTGIAKSPGYPKTYPDQMTCTYSINVPLGNVILINFIDFDIEQPVFGECGYDYLKIYDSDKALNGTELGKYCGSNEYKPPAIVSSHNYVYMEFNSDVSISGTGFKLNYTSVATGCGGIHKEYSGTIEYPDMSKDKYENNKRCEWILSAPPGYVIQIMKTVFDLEFTNKCTADYVEIYNIETLTGSKELLGRFCGSDFPSAMTSVSNMISIVFESDSTQVANGFSFHYLFSDVRKVCGGTYLSSSGVISSPGWPEQYPARKDCSWVIRAPEGQQVALNVSKFELERHSDCSGDYLEIRNGGYENSPLIGKYCGTDIPLKIPSLTNLMYLHFHSDMSRNYMGFYITWDSTSTGCGGVLTSSHGSIISPNFPNRYGHDAECFWRITTSAGSQISLTFASLDLEHATFCVFDYVEIFDGIDSSDRIGRYCSLESVHKPIISKANHVFVRFRTDISTAGLGFMLNYNTVCNRNLTDLNGVIESPNFPNRYPDQMDCLWIIKAPKGNKINITFSHFELEEYLQKNVYLRSVDHDYVALKDGLDVNYTKIYVGDRIPPPYQSSDNLAFVHFHTDYSHRQSGFRLEWAVDGCGGYLRHPSDTFTSPGYPNMYPVDTECQWIIEVDPEKSIELKINDLDTELVANCQFDSLSIYNGPSDNYPQLLNLCGKHEANYSVVTSTGNYLFVRFHSDSSIASRGFKATYRSIDSKCGGLFKGFSGIITSPNYPNSYDDNMECFYYLEVPEFHRMSLQFTDFKINSVTGNCSDFVKVYDVGSSSSVQTLLGTFCHSEVIDVITSTSNKMMVEFRSDSVMSTKGFSANYTMLCGYKIITTTEGIVSRDNVYNLNGDNCTWTIVSERLEDKVSLTFTYLDTDVDVPEECSNDYVEVFAGESHDSPSLGKFCGTSSPPTIVSRGNALTIQLVTNYLASFSFHYSVLNTACGGNLTSEMGEFTSPMYPDSYGPNLGCVWTINVSPGTGITLSFSEFKLQTSENCDQDYIEIREGDGVGRLIGVYCDATPPSIQSFKKLWIKFSSDSEGTEKGFNARYSYNQENDIQDMDAGQLTSPLYPRGFRQEAVYDWRITVSPGGYILLTIKDIVMQMVGSTCYSSLEIFDGYSSDSPVLGSLCGLEDPISSTANVVYIRFISHEFASGNTFSLEWMRMPLENSDSQPNKNCGGNHSVYLTDTQYVLKSPGYPEGYNDNLHCEWIFETTPTQHLVLKFTEVSLEESFNCNTDKISVYSGDKGSKNWKMIGSHICQPNATLMENIHVNNLLKVVFETDISVNKSGFAAVIYADCGNTLTESSGVITSAGFSEMSFVRLTWIDCEWDITVRNGRKIKVEFSTLNIVNNENLCNVYVMVRDGGSVHSPLLGKGKFCDSLRPESPLITSSNRLHIASSRPSILMQRYMTNTSFEIRFSEVTLPCGDRITLTADFNSTEITSPNYPEIPHPHSECSWVFVGQAGVRLNLNFIDRFDLTSSKGCEQEFVEIRDGGTELSPLLGRFCTKPTKTILSTNNMLYLKFVTDIPIPKNGFKAKVSVDICGGTLYGTRGKITSPTMLQLAFSPSDVVCDWHIIVPSTHIIYINIKLYMNFIDDGCTYSNLQVLDPRFDPFTNETNAPLTEKICPQGKPSVIVTTPSNEAIVRYSIAKSQIHKGIFSFVVNFNTSEETCGGDFNQPSGIIELPKTMYYGRGCEWRLTVPEGRRIRLEFVENDTTEVQTKPSGFWIGVFNGHSTKMLLTFFLRFSNTSRVVESSGNKMYIMFLGRSKSFSESRLEMPSPFQMIYTSDDPSVCDGQFAYGEGIILPPTPSFPKAFCEYPYKTIDDQFNGTIMVEHNDPNPNICDSVKYNYLVYVHVPGVRNYGKLCPRAIILSPYVNTVINIQRANNISAGYVIHYKVFHCGGVINDIGDGSNIFVLPTNHTGALRCAWVINFPKGTTLEMTINQLVFASHSCNDEFMHIKLERTFFSIVNTKICYNQLPNNVLTFSDQLISIEYIANNFSSNTILNISMSIKNEDQSNLWTCGGELIWPTAKTFTTPNFPQQYTENKECEWILNGGDGYRVSLTFENRFHLETSPNCTKDYIEISDFKAKTWTVVGRYCGRTVPPVINATADKLKVLFHSDDTVNADGFKARWSLFCGGTLEVTSESQILKSPGRGVYERNLDCTYLFESPEDSYINLKFEYFLLEAGANRVCKYDNLTISPVASPQEEEVFCGSNSPEYKRMMGPIMLRFMTDKWVQRKGYSILYSLDNCGGNITKSGETISSTANNNMYFPSIECKWNITAPSDKAVTISFRRLILEFSNDCDYDYVEIYDGMESTKPLAKLCGNLTLHLPVFKSKGNEMRVVFKTDSSNQLEGFAAKIEFSYDERHGCGGQINLTTELSPLHIFADKEVYEPYLDCHWIFKAPVDNFVTIKFTEFNVSKCFNSSTIGNCECDYLEIRDGLSSNSELIGKYCGDALPENVTSSKNYLWMRFVSDGTVQSSGIQIYANAEPSICGPSILNVTDEIQVLESPGFSSGKLPNNFKCDWLLTTDTSNIHIHFTDFDVGVRPLYGNHCDTEYVKLIFEKITTEENSHVMSKPLAELSYSFFNDPYSMSSLSPPRSFCGNFTQFEDFFFYSNVRVRLITSNSEIKHAGFRLQYSNIVCSRNYTKNYGRIISQLPFHAKKDDCKITIIAPENYTISLYIDSYSSDISKCVGGHFEVLDGIADNSPSLARFCEDVYKTAVFSKTNKVTLNLNSHNARYYTYVMTFLTTDKGRGCGGNILDRYGTIFSPLYPEPYRDNVTCEWTINTPDTSMTLHFEVFDIGFTKNCDSNYVEFIDENELSLTKYCTKVTPAPFTVFSNYVKIVYKTNQNNYGIGWTLTFTRGPR